MSPKQNTFYWRLWGQVKKAKPDADRKEMHAQPSEAFPDGLPESHTAWGNAEMDEWIKRCSAITQPANFKRQVHLADMPATRERVFIGHLLAALEKPESYAEAIVTRMQRNRRWKTTGAGSVATLATLPPERLRDVVIALKKECRRTWPTKEELLRAIQCFCEEANIDDHAGIDAVKAALNAERLMGLPYMKYEELLVALSALRRMVKDTPLLEAALGAGNTAVDIPW